MKLYGALIGLSFIWGLSFVFIKWLTESAGVWGTVFLRCLAGAMLLMPFLWTKRKQVTQPIPWMSLVIVGIFNAGLPWGLIALSETQITSNTAAVINALTPICSGLIGFLFFDKQITKKQWVGIIIGFIGILVLVEFRFSVLWTQSFIGIGTMCIATICYGFASQYMKKYVAHVGVLFVTTCTLIVGAGIGLIGSFATHSMPLPSDWNYHIILSIIGLGCFGSGIAHLLYYYLMKEGSPEFATTVTYLIPATAMIWGHVLLKEAITNHLIIGLLLILVGVYVSSKPSVQKAELPKSTCID
ncbi:DMT family transporter [Anoxybacteroides amylolyticum]|uniref:EamA-like transporter family protein n=1 Tax=Anoxybacteroides amylolyticum TaxID=294699 RepID=A0A167TFA4_9BACL|nr:DMT family transporter [Anoxybacillus amylolyticus]ANB60460.1 eamA-like transporter family protein [Anoxybacillus amylolyticus]